MRRMISIVSTLALAACDDGSAPPSKPSCEGKSGCIVTVIGNGSNALPTAEGARGLDTPMAQPLDGVVDPKGRLLFIDWNNHMIRVWDPATDKATSIAGTGEIGDLGAGGPALQARLNHPTGLLLLPDGSLLVAAWHNSKLKRIDLATGKLTDRCGTGGRNFKGDGGPAAQAVLDLPSSVVADAKGNLFLMDQANQRIRKIDGNDTIWTVVGDRWVTDTGRKDGKPVQDAKGYYLDCTQTPVADADKFAVVKSKLPDGSDTFKRAKDANDKEISMASDIPVPNRCAGFGGDGGPMAEATIGMQWSQSAIPNGRMVYDDGADAILFADSMNHRVRRIDFKAGTISTVAGSGALGYAGDGGPATAAMLNTPVDVDLLADGTLLIADLFNSCVRAVDKAGTIRTFAGTCTKKGFAGDGGPAKGALLNRPYGVTVDRTSGRVYIADTNNDRIRVVTP